MVKICTARDDKNEDKINGSINGTKSKLLSKSMFFRFKNGFSLVVCAFTNIASWASTHRAVIIADKSAISTIDLSHSTSLSIRYDPTSIPRLQESELLSFALYLFSILVKNKGSCIAEFQGKVRHIR